MTAIRPHALVAFLALVFTALNGCAAPSATQATQTVSIRAGDEFALLSPSPDGHPMQAMDAIALREAKAHTGPSRSGRQWLLEYSYAVRPAKIGMTSDVGDYSLSLPKPDAMLECNKTSHRVSVRITDAETGLQSYRGTAEKLDCRTDLAADEAVFAELIGLALNSLKVE